MKITIEVLELTDSIIHCTYLVHKLPLYVAIYLSPFSKVCCSTVLLFTLCMAQQTQEFHGDMRHWPICIRNCQSILEPDSPAS